MQGFTIFVDRDNASQTAVAQTPLFNAIRNAPVGKTFQSCGLTNTARKALGDVKNKQSLGVQTTQPQMLKHELNFSKDLTKSFQECKKQSGKITEKVNVAVNTKDSRKFDNEPPEFMLPYNEEEEDDFNDLWPVSERPVSYLEQICKFRPPTLWCFPEKIESTPEEIQADDHEVGFPVRTISPSDLNMEVGDEAILNLNSIITDDQNFDWVDF